MILTKKPLPQNNSSIADAGANENAYAFFDGLEAAKACVDFE
jgi:hypothetical protein